jgi:hypothetical protein
MMTQEDYEGTVLSHADSELEKAQERMLTMPAEDNAEQIMAEWLEALDYRLSLEDPQTLRAEALELHDLDHEHELACADYWGAVL